MNLLPEDPDERRYFDDMVRVTSLSPLALVQNALRNMHIGAEHQNSSYAKTLAIYANEIGKALANPTSAAANEDERAAVEFYIANPRAALADLRRRLAPSAGVEKEG